jgi:hypothetical protein
MRVTIQILLGKADALIAAIDGTTDQFEPETAAFSKAASAAERLVGDSSEPQNIVLTIRYGLIDEVTGIPAGYELRVEDYDGDDASHPAWNAEKECFVTVFDGSGV